MTITVFGFVVTGEGLVSTGKSELVHMTIFE